MRVAVLPLLFIGVVGVVSRPWPAIVPRGARSRPARSRWPRHGMVAARAAARRAGRGRGAQARRQRRGRGDRRQRLPRPDGADLVRPRRRPVRDRLGPATRQAPRAQRLGPRAAGAHARQGPARAGRHHPALLAVRVDRARAAPTAGSSCTRGSAGCRCAELLAPAIAYAEEGFPLSPVIAGEWARGVARFKDKPGFAEVFMPGGSAPGEGETFANPALARTLRCSRRGAATPTTGARSPRRSCVLAEGRRLLRAGGLRAPHRRLGRADLDRLPRHDGLGAAAQRPGAGRAADAQHARELRPQGAWAATPPTSGTS